VRREFRLPQSRLLPAERSHESIRSETLADES
jgi:hypothetical protein